MSYQALYRAWRPETFSQICGQEAVVRTLRRQVVTGQIAHAYLFCGTRGTGKTTAAKVLSRAINCLHPDNGDPCGECEICKALRSETCMDVMEIDAASNNSVDEIRDLRDKIKYPPTLTNYKVYIIDEVHMLSTGAFNALLKTLEEPPKHAVFILATTEPQKLPATILSRCQRFDFHRIGVDTIIARLRTVLDGIGRSADEDALNEIARAAEGAMRDALSLLDVCLSFSEGGVTGELARDVLGTTGRDFMFEFTDALISCDAAAALGKIDEAMRRGSDERVFAADTAAHLRGILMVQTAPDRVAELMEVTQEDAQRYCEQAKRANTDMLLRVLDLYIHADGDMKQTTRPRTILELITVRACHPEQEHDATVEERMARLEKMMESGVRPAAPASAQAVRSAQAMPAPAQRKAPVKTAVPAVELPPEWDDFLKRTKDADIGAWNFLQRVRFGGIDSGVLTLMYAKRDMLGAKVLERKKDLMEGILQECFGYPLTVNIAEEGAQTDTAGKASAAARRAIEQASDIFGRENIEVID